MCLRCVTFWKCTSAQGYNLRRQCYLGKMKRGRPRSAFHWVTTLVHDRGLVHPRPGNSQWVSPWPGHWVSEIRFKEKKSMGANALEIRGAGQGGQVWTWCPVRVPRLVVGKSEDTQSREGLATLPSSVSGANHNAIWSGGNKPTANPPTGEIANQAMLHISTCW